MDKENRHCCRVNERNKNNQKEKKKTVRKWNPDDRNVTKSSK